MTNDGYVNLVVRRCHACRVGFASCQLYKVATFCFAWSSPPHLFHLSVFARTSPSRSTFCFIHIFCFPSTVIVRVDTHNHGWCRYVVLWLWPPLVCSTRASRRGYTTRLGKSALTFGIRWWNVGWLFLFAVLMAAGLLFTMVFFVRLVLLSYRFVIC